MKYLDLSKYNLFFFGSRVFGRGTDRSDIDIGIQGQNPISTETLQAIEEEIETIPTLYKIDVVDFARVPERFRNIALERVESF